VWGGHQLKKRTGQLDATLKGGKWETQERTHKHTHTHTHTHTHIQSR